jgi:hypothetical protein
MDRIIKSVSKCTTLVEKLISPDMERQKTEQQFDSLNRAVKPSYAEIVSQELLVNMDPIKSNIKISKGRDGSVIITCDNSDDSNKIKDMISNNLPNYLHF